MSSLVESVAVLMDELATLANWQVYPLTPLSINAPAVFPGAVESIRNHDQSGDKVAVISLWVLYSSQTVTTQIALYDGAEAVWAHLDSVATGVQGRVIELTSVGEVEMAGQMYWGGRLRVELWY